VIPEFKAVCDFSFFVEFLAKLCGEKKVVSDKLHHKTSIISHMYLANRTLPDSAGGVRLISLAFW
jgi:hypothetical protein